MDIPHFDATNIYSILGTAFIMIVGYIIQYRRYKQEVEKQKEEATKLKRENAALEAETNGAIIKGWKEQVENNNLTISNLFKANLEKDGQIELLKDELTTARDELREAKSELRSARREMDKMKKIMDNQIKELKTLQDKTEKIKNLDNLAKNKN